MGKFIGAFFLVVIAVLGLSWITTGNDFFLYKFFAPKQENVRRQVYENTQSYVEGKATYISSLRLEYKQADAGHKAALAEEILSEASTVDNTKLPADLQSFINDLKGGQ